MRQRQHNIRGEARSYVSTQCTVQRDSSLTSLPQAAMRWSWHGYILLPLVAVVVCVVPQAACVTPATLAVRPGSPKHAVPPTPTADHAHVPGPQSSAIGMERGLAAPSTGHVGGTVEEEEQGQARGNVHDVGAGVRQYFLMDGVQYSVHVPLNAPNDDVRPYAVPVCAAANITEAQCQQVADGLQRKRTQQSSDVGQASQPVFGVDSVYVLAMTLACALVHERARPPRARVCVCVFIVGGCLAAWLLAWLVGRLVGWLFGWLVMTRCGNACGA